MVDTSLRARLQRLFSSQVIVRRIGKKRIKVVDTEKLQQAGSKDRNRYRNYAGGMHTARTGNSNGQNSVMSFHVDKLQLYTDYEAMDTDPIIASALDIYSDECTVRGVTGELLIIKSSNENIKKILYNLFYEILNIEYNLWSWIRNLCKYGDFYLNLDVVEGLGIKNVMPISPYYVERVEAMNPDNPYDIVFNITQPSAFEYMRGKSSTLENFEVAHFRLLSDTNFLPYGKSIIEPARKIFKMLTLMEDAMLIHRIMRAPQRRVFKVDVGNIPPEEVEQHMQNIINEMKKVPHIDPATGDYNLKFNLQNMIEDFYLPVRGQDSGTNIETLDGMSNEGYIEDVDYVRNRMMAALKIPKAWFGYDEGVEGKGTLAAEDIRFARTIERVQNIVVSELTKMAIIHLYSQGYEDGDLVDFDLGLTSPSIVYERQKVDMMNEKVNLINNAKELQLFSNKYLYESIWNMGPEEWAMEQQLLIQDQKTKFRLNQIEAEGNDPAVSKQSFGTPHDIASMHTATKADLIDKVEDESKEETRGRPEAGSDLNTNRDTVNGRNPLGDQDLKSDTEGTDKEPLDVKDRKDKLAKESKASTFRNYLTNSGLGSSVKPKSEILKEVYKDIELAKKSRGLLDESNVSEEI